MAVSSLGADAHVAALIAMIRERAESAIPEVADVLQASAAERAPTMEQEYRELNAESGQQPLTPMTPSGQSDDQDARTRFAKPENTYLQNAIRDGRNIDTDAANLRARVGNYKFLTDCTYFQYTNVGAGGATFGPYKVGPYFNMFEGGTAGAAVNESGITTFEVEPHGNRMDGGYYPLRPGAGPDDTRKSMVKSITGRFMFDPGLLQTQASEVLRGAMAEIGPGADQ